MKRYTYTIMKCMSFFLLFGSASAEMILPDRIQQQVQGDQGFSIVSLDMQLLPQEIKDTFFENITDMNTQGYFEVEEQLLGKLETASEMSDDFLSPYDEIKDQVGFTPIDVNGTRLDHPGKGKHKKTMLIGAALSGSFVDGKSSGLFRLFSVPEFGLIGLSENDISISGGGMKMYLETLNSEIHGKPAAFTAKKSKEDTHKNKKGKGHEKRKGKGHSRYFESELTWINGTKIYNLVSNKLITAPGLKKKFMRLAESLN